MAVIIVLVAVVGALTYGYVTTRNELMRVAGDNKDSGKSETEQLVQKIGAYLELPNEEPTLATVNDASKLKTQNFFKNAENGDKVLIYQQAGRALIYRPSTQKVIEYARVNLGSNPTPVTTP